MSFCGSVLHTYEEHFGQFCVGYDLKTYFALKYKRMEGEYHVFSLPFKHPGNKYFKGCSGAPILSSKGVLVGLVCEGREDDSEIWAISLKSYKIAIDVLIGNIADINT